MNTYMSLLYIYSSVRVEFNPRAHIRESRHSLGRMNIPCPRCFALHWMDEKLSNSSLQDPHFGMCCLQGTIKLPPLVTPPPELQELYDGVNDKSKTFREHIREYNAANAFTSLGTTFDPRLIPGSGPISFTIHGKLRHRTGSHIPQPDQDAVYSQLYIYDPQSALDSRRRRNPQLRIDILEIIQRCLLGVNPFS